METLERMVDLGFALVRGKIRLGISFIGVGKWTYEKVQIWEEKKTLKWPIHTRWYRYQ